jgi:hypothetical protein
MAWRKFREVGETESTGFSVRGENGIYRHNGYIMDVPPYTTNLTSFRKIIEKMRADSFIHRSTLGVIVTLTLYNS